MSLLLAWQNYILACCAYCHTHIPALLPVGDWSRYSGSSFPVSSALRWRTWCWWLSCWWWGPTVMCGWYRMEQQLRRESVGPNVQMHFLDGVVSIIPQLLALLNLLTYTHRSQMLVDIFVTWLCLICKLLVPQYHLFCNSTVCIMCICFAFICTVGVSLFNCVVAW